MGEKEGLAVFAQICVEQALAALSNREKIFC